MHQIFLIFNHSIQRTLFLLVLKYWKQKKLNYQKQKAPIPMPLILSKPIP
jgi:hypothetical protein